MREASSDAAALLQVRGVSKTYPGSPTPAVTNMTLGVGPGEIVGLLGPNGAGKTTAIAMMSGLLPPDSGSVSLKGFDLFRESRRAKRHFGLVPQHLALYPALTGRENLAYFGKLHGLRGNRLGERVAACVEVAGLDRQADRRVETYSGGMKRRLNLAAALLHEPALLFLDEPSVGIDAQSRGLIFEKLAALRSQGTGMIYTTHYMEEAEQLCTRVAVMDSGGIIAEGTVTELLERHPDCANLGELFLALTGKALRD